MKTFAIAMLGAAVLVLPAGAVAKPDATDKRAAIKQCKAERGKTKATRQAFKARYHSFSRCVRQNAAEEHAENQAALKAATKDCKAERADDNFPATHDGKTFQQFYGSNKNGKNAYGKCVSTKAHEQKAAKDADDAEEGAAERSDSGFPAGHDGKTFEEFYGTNRNKRNAFGKCVSSKSPTYVDPFS